MTRKIKKRKHEGGFIILLVFFAERQFIDMDFKKFINQHGFQKMGENIYFRISNNIVFDVLEIRKQKQYFKVDLSVYCLLSKYERLYCIASQNLKTLQMPLYQEYWWVGNPFLNITMADLLEKEAENFWGKYNSIDKIVANIRYYTRHTDDGIISLKDEKSMLYLYMAQNNKEQAEMIFKKIKLHLNSSVEENLCDIDLKSNQIDDAWFYYSQSYDKYKVFITNMSKEILQYMKQQNEEISFCDRDENRLLFYWNK